MSGGHEDGGHEEVEHTADRAIRAWSPTFAGLLQEVARGMYGLADIAIEAEPRQVRVIDIHGRDREDLLVDFLSELLFFAEGEGLAFDVFAIEVEPDRLRARLEGAAIARQSRLIKAVTFHDLRVRQTPEGLEAIVVFDV